MPAVIKVMKVDSTLITLIKPQFEARRSQVRLNGKIIVDGVQATCYIYSSRDKVTQNK